MGSILVGVHQLVLKVAVLFCGQESHIADSWPFFCTRMISRLCELGFRKRDRTFQGDTTQFADAVSHDQIAAQLAIRATTVHLGCGCNRTPFAIFSDMLHH